MGMIRSPGNPSPPLVSSLSVYEARAGGLTVAVPLAVETIANKPISYLNTLFRQGGDGLKETEPF